MVLVKFDDEEINVNISENVLSDLKEFLKKYEKKKLPNVIACYNIKKNECREAYRKRQCKLRGIEYDGTNYTRKNEKKIPETE